MWTGLYKIWTTNVYFYFVAKLLANFAACLRRNLKNLGPGQDHSWNYQVLCWGRDEQLVKAGTWLRQPHPNWGKVLALLVSDYLSLSEYHSSRQANLPKMQRSYGNNGLCHCCRSHWFGWQHAAIEPLLYLKSSCCHWAIAILKYLLCLSAGFSWLSIWTQLFAFSFQLTTCTCWTSQWLGHCWCWLTQTGLATQTWNLLRQLQHHTQVVHCLQTVQTQTWNLFRQLQHHTQVVHCLQIVHCGLLLLMRQRWQKRCHLSCSAQPPWWLHLMTTQWTNNVTYEISKQLPN